MDEEKKTCGNCGWVEDFDLDNDALVLCYLNDVCFYVSDNACSFWKLQDYPAKD